MIAPATSQSVVASPAERAREHFAAWLLIVHQIWFGLFIAAAVLSTLAECARNDDCVAVWGFGWALLWVIGEIVLAVPVVIATLYLAVRLFRGSRKAPCVGLGSWAVFVLIWIGAEVAGNAIFSG
jgi:hypothetical protein